jgi:hypothetical protein
MGSTFYIFSIHKKANVAEPQSVCFPIHQSRPKWHSTSKILIMTTQHNNDNPVNASVCHNTEISAKP